MMKKPLNILLISPIGRSVLGRAFCFKLPFLSLPMIAAYTPDDCEVRVVDERVASIDFDAEVDLVGITVMTPMSIRAYEIADEFRRRGRTVVLGGMHISALPDEALAHADAVVIGEGESCWPDLIADFRAGCLKPKYHSDRLIDLAAIRAPRWDVMDEESYVPVKLIESTRGCPFRCHFCAVAHFFGGKYRTKPVSAIVDQIASIKPLDTFWSLKNVLFFVDDNIIGHRAHAIELLTMLKEHDIQWFGQASLTLADHDDLLELMRQTRCRGLEIGVESLSEDCLAEAGKGRVNKPDRYLKSIEKIHSYGIGIQASFIVGFEHDTTDTFAQIDHFIRQSKISVPYFSIMTPYPGTNLHKQMEAEGRLLHRNWEDYDTAHVVFQPKGMSIEELHEGYKWLWRKSYSLPTIVSRISRARSFPAFFIPTNFGFKYSVHVMLKEMKSHPNGP
ncbi:MAG: B12-binding domain-containing radical SAM protein [Spartobacteria bacterium]|nr:B12-binding domain-containing radical SAM protein [Spartobacteria bacterium]